MNNALMADVVLVAVVLGSIATGLSVIPVVLKNRSIGKADIRCLTHAVSFSLLAAGTCFLDNQWVAIIAGVLVIPFLIAAVERESFAGLMHASRARDYGLVMSAAGFVALVVLFFPHQELIAAALLIVGLGDAGASVLGRRFGRHHIRAWGSDRTLEGSSVLASVAFAVSLAFFSTTGQLTVGEVGLSAFVALTTALIELIAPSAIDNIVIPVWSGFLLWLAQTDDADIFLAWPFAVLIGVMSAPLIYRLKWMDAPGTVASALIAAVAMALGGWKWLLPITVFLATSSLLTKFRQSEPSQKRPRGLQQALVNGILPMLPVLGHAVDGRPVWYFLYVGAVAVANADTWSTEIGRLSRTHPISLRTLKPVPRGTSGAVSPLGTLGSVCGGALIGGAAAVVAQPAWQPLLLLSGILVGPLGAFIDSFLGAWAQCRFRCGSCDHVGEVAAHCGVPGHRVSGLRVIDNDAVNAIANGMGMVIVFEVYDLLA